MKLNLNFSCVCTIDLIVMLWKIMNNESSKNHERCCVTLFFKAFQKYSYVLRAYNASLKYDFNFDLFSSCNFKLDDFENSQ